MEKFTLDHDIQVLCLTADSFPEGVHDVHEKLHAMVNGKRTFFGISRPEHGRVIVYKAACEMLPGDEDKKPGLESFTIKKGEFACITLKDYYKDIPAVGRAFQELLALPNLDPEGYCLEWYLSEQDVRCMVPLV